MGVYQENAGINIVERFWTIDPITEVETLGDPTDVYFHLVAPDDTETVYHYPGDVLITRFSTGVYVLGPLAFANPGIYRYWAEGVGALDAVAPVETFSILPDGSLQPEPVVPIFGPCQSWISGDDIGRCGPDLELGSETWRLDQAAADASTLLYELTGRQFPGVCERTVRPCAAPCSHWNYLDPMLAASWGYDGWGWGWDGYSGFWRDRRGDTCGCNPLSEVKLAGYPVRRIVSVKIDGTVLASVDSDGFRNYRLDRNRKLVRMGGANGLRYWPSCQNLAYDDDQPGTFSVTYEWGVEPPPMGLLAAAQLGRELWNACDPNATCALTSGVVQVVRQGITITRVSPLADLLRSGGSGIQLVDAFIAAANPTKMQRRPLIYSPDVARYGRPTG